MVFRFILHRYTATLDRMPHAGPHLLLRLAIILVCVAGLSLARLDFDRARWNHFGSRFEERGCGSFVRLMLLPLLCAGALSVSYSTLVALWFPLLFARNASPVCNLTADLILCLYQLSWAAVPFAAGGHLLTGGVPGDGWWVRAVAGTAMAVSFLHFLCMALACSEVHDQRVRPQLELEREVGELRKQLKLMHASIAHEKSMSEEAELDRIVPAPARVEDEEEGKGTKIEKQEQQVPPYEP